MKTDAMMKTVAVIPAHNEEKNIKKVVEETRPHVNEVVVVDDGSQDNTAREAEDGGALVLKHEKNMGLGCAIRTGLEHALKSGADIIVTLDGDGQHNPKSIPTLVKKLVEDKADVVLGSRFLKSDNKKVPWIRNLSNTLSTRIIRFLTGYNITDSQSGFKAIKSDAIRRMNLKGKSMEIASEIILKARKNNLRLVEVPVETIYGDEKSDYRYVRDTLRIAFSIIKNTL